VRQLNDEFSKARELMTQRYSTLEMRYAELQSAYDSRPSRPEDLEQMRYLQQQLEEREAQLQKAYEDMKKYKLDLINKEDTYNKVFSRTPNVGVLNPIKVCDIPIITKLPHNAYSPSNQHNHHQHSRQREVL